MKPRLPGGPSPPYSPAMGPVLNHRRDFGSKIPASASDFPDCQLAGASVFKGFLGNISLGTEETPNRRLNPHVGSLWRHKQHPHGETPKPSG